jgi:hypothetical protein
MDKIQPHQQALGIVDRAVGILSFLSLTGWTSHISGTLENRLAQIHDLLYLIFT